MLVAISPAVPCKDDTKLQLLLPEHKKLPKTSVRLPAAAEQATLLIPTGPSSCTTSHHPVHPLLACSMKQNKMCRLASQVMQSSVGQSHSSSNSPGCSMLPTGVLCLPIRAGPLLQQRSSTAAALGPWQDCVAAHQRTPQVRHSICDDPGLHFLATY